MVYITSLITQSDAGAQAAQNTYALYFTGFVFDRRLEFNILLYTSTATLSAVAAGYVGYAFHMAFALRAGYFSLPSTRAMTGTYPFFPGTDRSMATNYVRPGFTQGVWADGEPLPGLFYIAMIGNSLNTLDIGASRIDQNFAYGSTIWYDHNRFGKPWNDYEHHEAPALRLGTAFTFAREDRLSDLTTSNPENNSIFISDGSLLFETGALAPDITLDLANFYLWAIDASFKYRGLALNAELYLRWLNEFRADGPVPLDSMFDWGFEASVGYFVLRRKLETYVRSSFIRGPFATAVEGAVGVHWYPFGTRQVWLSGEVIGIKDSPYQSVLIWADRAAISHPVPRAVLTRHLSDGGWRVPRIRRYLAGGRDGPPSRSSTTVVPYQGRRAHCSGVNLNGTDPPPPVAGHL